MSKHPHREKHQDQQKTAGEIRRRWWSLTLTQLLCGLVAVGVVSWLPHRGQSVSYPMAGERPVVVKTDKGPARRASGATQEATRARRRKQFLRLRRHKLSEMLALSDQLHLSADQISKLEKLMSFQTEELTSVEAELAGAEKEFAKFMESNKNRRLSMEEIMKESRPASQAGRRKRLLLEDYWRRGERLLNDEQQAALRQQLSR